MKTMYVEFKELVNCGDLVVTKHNFDGSIEEKHMTSEEFIKYINDKRRRGVNGITTLPDRDFYIAKYDLNYTDFVNVGMAALYAGCDDHEAINSLKSYINKVQDIFSKLACEDFDAAEAIRKDSKEFLADLISKAKAFLNHASMEAFADEFVESLNTLHSIQMNNSEDSEYNITSKISTYESAGYLVTDHINVTADEVIRFEQNNNFKLFYCSPQYFDELDSGFYFIVTFFGTSDTTSDEFFLAPDEAEKYYNMHEHTEQFVRDYAEFKNNINNKPDEYDECDMIDVQAMYDDEAELNAVARYELTNSDDFKSLINNLESAAEELNGAFDYVAQAVEPLINEFEDLCDPYLNMMYEMDYDWYDNYINMQAEMFAAA